MFSCIKVIFPTIANKGNETIAIAQDFLPNARAYLSVTGKTRQVFKVFIIKNDLFVDFKKLKNHYNYLQFCKLNTGGFMIFQHI